MRRLAACTLTVSSLAFWPVSAAELALSVEIPRLTVAEYHRPYVAIWLENKSRKTVTNLAVWYDFKLKDGEGTKWLKDMRQWWRTTGRDLKMPVDGITGATRAPGEHAISFTAGSAPLGAIEPGQYELLIEAAREVGGREVLRIPVEWPPSKAGETKVAGEHEIGAVKMTLKP